MSEFKITLKNRTNHSLKLEEELKMLHRITKKVVGNLPQLEVEFLKKKITHTKNKVFKITYDDNKLDMDQNFQVLRNLFKMVKMRTKNYQFEIFVE